jgi:hypothetical protein
VVLGLFGHVTALDVAFVSATLTGLVGIASPFSTSLVAKSQRKADLNARVYADKRDAYRALGFDWYKGRELLDGCSQKLADADDGQAGDLIDQLKADIDGANSAESQRLSNFAVLASNKVRKAFEKLVDVWNETVEPLWAIEKSQAGYAGEAKATIDGALKAIEAPMVNFRDAMRDDLCA